MFRVITNPDFSKVSRPKYLIFSIFVSRNPVFQTVGKPHLWPLYLSIMERGLQLKTTICYVRKTFEKLVNIRLTDHIKKWGLFSDFQYGFWSSCSTANLLTVISDKIIGVFNRSGTNWAVALDITMAFDMIWHPGLFHELNSHKIWGQVSCLILSFLDKRGLQVGLDGKGLQGYPTMPVFLKALLLVLLFP